MNFPWLAAGPLPDIEDIVGPADWPQLLRIILWSLLGVVLLAAIGVAVFVFVIKPRRQIRQPSPLIQALHALRTLEGRADQLSPNEFSLKVSDILKDFFQARFKDPLRYETSEEFLQRLASLPPFALDRPGGKAQTLPGDLGEMVAVFLQTCDEIKYGRRVDAEHFKRPLLDQAHAILSAVREETPMPAKKS